MSLMPEIKRGAVLGHLTTLSGWRRHAAEHRSPGTAGSVTRTWYSRSKCLLLSGALAVGTLAGLAIATPAYAATPQIFVTGGPGEITVTGSGFTPGTTIRLEALTPSLSTVLGETVYATADSAGNIVEGSRGYAEIGDLSPYVGQVWVAADGAPGPTAWAPTQVSPLPTFRATESGCPVPPGYIIVNGFNFQPGDTVTLELWSADSSWRLEKEMATTTVAVAGDGSFPPSTPALRVSQGYSGHALVAAHESFPGALDFWVSLDYVC